MEPKKNEKPATDREIRTILGSIADEDLVMDVRNTGATYEEVLQAFEWLDDDDYMGKQIRKPLNGMVRRVYELLLVDREGPED